MMALIDLGNANSKRFVLVLRGTLPDQRRTTPTWRDFRGEGVECTEVPAWINAAAAGRAKGARA
jgi:hypothetical protein